MSPFLTDAAYSSTIKSRPELLPKAHLGCPMFCDRPGRCRELGVRTPHALGSKGQHGATCTRPDLGLPGNPTTWKPLTEQPGPAHAQLQTRLPPDGSSRAPVWRKVGKQQPLPGCPSARVRRRPVQVGAAGQGPAPCAASSGDGPVPFSHCLLVTHRHRGKERWVTGDAGRGME